MILIGIRWKGGLKCNERALLTEVFLPFCVLLWNVFFTLMEIKLLGESRAWLRGGLWGLPWGLIIRTTWELNEKPKFLGRPLRQTESRPVIWTHPSPRCWCWKKRCKGKNHDKTSPFCAITTKPVHWNHTDGVLPTQSLSDPNVPDEASHPRLPGGLPLPQMSF